MKRISSLLVAVAAASTIVASADRQTGHADEAAPIFGIKIPSGYRDWRLISVDHEEGNLNDLCPILGSEVAIKASREGKLPFPVGTIIARLAWSYDRWRKAKKPVLVSNHSWPSNKPGHFSAWEEPRLFSEDLRAAFRSLR